MRSTIFNLLLILFLSISDANGQSATAGPTLWYKQPAKNWNEALPVGNGRLGAMVFGDAVREHIQLNEESLWAGSKTNADADAAATLPVIQQKLLNGDVKGAIALSEQSLRSHPMRIRSYQPVGDVYIDFFKRAGGMPKLTSYRRQLDLANGMATTAYTYDNITFTREVFVSAPDDVVIIRLTSSQPGKLSFRLSLGRTQDASVTPSGSDGLLMQGQIVDLPDADAGPEGLHMKFAALLRGTHQGGTLQALYNSVVVQNADEVVFYLTAATDYNLALLNYDRSIDPVQRCQNILNQARQKSYSALKDAHVAEHTAMFNRVAFRLGTDDKQHLPTDQRLQAVKDGAEDQGLAVLQFQYGRYLLMGSSRAPGVLPANLQGIWNQDMEAAWNSDFHTNINIQMNYWPVETCNLSDAFAPFSGFINRLREPGRETARKTYGSRGWTMNHLTDVFGRTAITDGVGWGTFPMAGPWLVLHQWEHYLFTRDRDYLQREAWPAMKESAEFVLGFLVKDKNGFWVTAPSNSPENAYRLPNGEQYNLTYGATMDIQLITALFDACMAAGKLLGGETAFVAELEKVKKGLPPVKVSARYGTIQEWIEDYEEVEPGHRHMSHLFGLYPAGQINASTPELFAAARKTIERRHEYAKDGKGSYTGWSKAWAVNFYARLLDGDAAWKNILDMQRYLTLSNLFDNHPPFQIDGNFGLTAGIAEMLLQSHTRTIDLLPALPAAWSEGEISGLKARGNITVGMQWKNHRLTAVSLTSAFDQEVTLQYLGKTTRFKLKKGQPLVLDGGLSVKRA